MTSRHIFWLSILLISSTLLGGNFVAAQEIGGFQLFAPLVRNLDPIPIANIEALLASQRGGTRGIDLVSLVDQSATRIADNNSELGPLVLSPNGNTVLYVGGTSGAASLYRVDVDGSNQTAITTVTGDAFDYRWSPDGQKILFYSITISREATLYVVDANGGSPIAIAERIYTSESAKTEWSPDGTVIGTQIVADDGTTDVVTITPDGATTTIITESDTNDYFAGWLNGGDLMLVNHYNGEDYDIYTYDASGVGAGTEIVGTSANTFAFSISPSGAYWLYVTGDDEQLGIVESADNSIITVDTGCVGVFCAVRSVTWSPDETEIAYSMLESLTPTVNPIHIYRASFLSPSPVGTLFIASADEFYWSPNPQYAIYRDIDSDADTFHPIVRNLVDGTEMVLDGDDYDARFYAWVVR